MNVLMIAPNAPPKNSPESIQVGRYLSELSLSHKVTLVTTPVERGWVRLDEGLRDVGVYSKIEVKLPMHNLMLRLLGSKFGAPFRMPDKDFWIRYKASDVLSKLEVRPDIIYSRSTPYSAALLAREMKLKIGCPWVMHLSDPWADNPYRQLGSDAALVDQEFEARCFEDSDAITVTTQSQLQFYTRKYPGCSGKLSVTPNVMPSNDEIPHSSGGEAINGKLKFVYTGGLYSERRPTALLSALQIILSADPGASQALDVAFAGNMHDDIRRVIIATGYGFVRVLGAMTFDAATALMRSADVLVSIEPSGEHELMKTFFPSKLLDYLSTGKPILAITPNGSEAWKLCHAGYGWAHDSNDSAGLAQRIQTLLALKRCGDALLPDPFADLVAEFRPRHAVRSLDAIFRRLTRTTV